MNDKVEITFEAVTHSHQDLILNWLDKPHVNEWFHGEGLENTIDGLRRYIEQDNPRWDCWVGYMNDTPFCFLMVSQVTEDLKDDATDPLAKWIEPNKKMITLDLLIGDEAYLGKSLATPMIRQFIESCQPDAAIVFIDPEATNTKAIHVYEKAGFKKLEQFIASWHPVPHWLMRLKK